jgi:CRP-like cAMP-binding protein
MQAFTKTYKSGAHFFHENDHSRELYIIQSGLVRVYRKIGTRDVDLARLSTGAVLGEMALIDGKPRSASARACEDTTVIMIDADTFHKRIVGVPPWFLSMIRTTSEKIRKANSRLEAIQTNNHCLHVVLALQYYFLRYGAVAGGGTQKTLDVTQTTSQLVQLLSVSHQCIMQVLDALQKKGVIDIRDGSIVLCDQAKIDGCCDYLRLLFKKSFDKMKKPSGRASALIVALQQAVASQTAADKGKEISPADMSAACAQCGVEKEALESVAELKDLDIVSCTKGAPPAGDSSPVAGYQFFIDPAVYEKFLLYCMYKDMVPNL